MSNGEAFDELLGEYWNLAYTEGKTGESQGDKANEVLHKLRTAPSITGTATMNREAFEAWVIQYKTNVILKRFANGDYISATTENYFNVWQAAIASQAHQPTDLSKQLREYAADSGYSHNDYADTMLAAASEIERCAARLAASQVQQTESKLVAWGYAWECKSVGDWRIEKLGEGCIPPKDTLALYTTPEAGDK